MNYLLAKIKGRNGGIYKVLSNGNEFFETPDDLTNLKKYDPGYKLEEDEWYSINNFSSEDYSLDILNKKFASTDYNQLSMSDYDKIEYLCAYQSGVYFFQKISPTQLVRKRYLSLANTPTLIDNEPLIIIHKLPDAVYDKGADMLIFKSLSAISSIFKGIAQLYREATQQETEDFLKNNFITLGPGYSAYSVKKANRKRIALAMDTLNSFSGKKKKDMLAYIKGYCKSLPFDNKKASFTIETEEELKLLLYGIEERFYTTHIGKEKRLANSVTTIQ